MKVKNKKVGDIYLNPVMNDLWILREDYDPEDNKKIWVLQLVRDDYYEQLEFVEGFIKIGNIYDIVCEHLRRGGYEYEEK